MIRTRNRDDTKTNCPVRFYVSLVRESGKFKVSDFVGEHNHTLHLSETVYMMRSQRKILEVHAGLIELAPSSGIKPKAAHELMSRKAGGKANLGFTELDQKNYLRTKWQKNLVYGQAACLLGVVIDYANFGDVVTFDTTYGTNKELRPLGVFTGFNHHRGLTVFGAALLYDETVESFKWLFESFLVAHGGKRPKTIFRDQDPTMAKALSEVMPNTYHGLCTWHIMQNGIKHLGNLMKDGSSFLQVFKTCMLEFNDENEFEKTWEDMIDTYAIHDRSWLDIIYKLKGKWAKCYMKNEFTLGIRSTQLSKSLNGDLKDYLKSDLDVAEFFKHFDRVIKKKREKELQAEFNARQKYPQLGLKNSPLLKQAVQVYTPIIPDMYILKRWTREAKSGSSRAVDNEEAFALIEKMIEEYEKKVEDIAAKNVSGHQLPHQMPLCSGAENLDPNQHLEDLVERAKGLKKKECRKGGKRKKSWVEKQTKKKGRVELNDEMPLTPLLSQVSNPTDVSQAPLTPSLSQLTPSLSQVSNDAAVCQVNIDFAV
ncbi:protein FAR1-RELATED SEQUENCE 5 [Quercus suber]|uniref:protein FAR1-RELATED SEQUENCE 5 n=1 Tax=Quercus suber TaxID=58331 RepID=UPI0032DF62E2